MNKKLHKSLQECVICQKMRYLVALILLILIIACIHPVRSICWIHKLNNRIFSLGANLPDTFQIDLPLERDPNGYFCIGLEVNQSRKSDFIIDTKATCLSRIEVLEQWDAKYWDTYPVNVKNTYGQKEKLDLYELESLSIDTLRFEKPLIKAITKSNALHNLLYKNVLGKDIICNMIWKFSLDENKISLFSVKDKDLLMLESDGFHCIRGGLRDNGCIITLPTLTDKMHISVIPTQSFR